MFTSFYGWDSNHQKWVAYDVAIPTLLTLGSWIVPDSIGEYWRVYCQIIGSDKISFHDHFSIQAEARRRSGTTIVINDI